MKFRLSFLLACCTATSVVLVTDSTKLVNQTQIRSAQIVGRAVAPVGSVPYQVSVRDVETDRHVCGGVIITDRWILTAAQCFDAILPDQNYIKVGTNEGNGDGGTRYNILDAVVHPQFDFSNNDFDYALVQTGRKIAFNQNIQPVKLARTNPPAGSDATFTGWRVSNRAGGSLAPRLQTIKLKVISQSRCSKLLPNLGVNQLCTLNTAAGQCNGDTGGPLVVNDRLVGVSSGKLPCVADVPKVFANTPRVNPWIRSTTGVVIN